MSKRSGMNDPGPGRKKEPVRIKFCGLSRIEDMEAASRLLPELIGFVFAKKSPRYVTGEEAGRLRKSLAPGILPAGVFVDEDPEHILKLIREGTIRAIQLHGSEGNGYIRFLKSKTVFPVIRAFRIRTLKDVEAANESEADLVLLDAGTPGSGRAFDHSLLIHIRRPFILAGGLDPENIAGILEAMEPSVRGLLYAVDVSSGIEQEGCRGKKDIKKMERFAAAVRAAERKDKEEQPG